MATPQVEAEHVHRVYDSIAAHFSHTRHHPWPQVTRFLRSQPPGALVADVGCGNAKYLAANPALCVIGADRSVPLLRAGVGDRRLDVLGADALRLPLRTAAFDAAICVAVLHHISTVERRLALLSELARVVRVRGQVMVVAWAFEQDERSKRKFEEQDVMVEWKLQEKYASDDQSAEHARKDDAKHWVVYERYCHVYREGELERLVEQTPGLRVVSVEYSRSNWCLLLERTNRLRLAVRVEMTDHNRDESENDGEKGSQIDDDNRSEHELVEGVDGNDTARIAQTITEYSRRCLQSGDFSKALVALQNAIEIAEMPSLAYRQAIFQTAQVLKASHELQSSITCMLTIYHSMPAPYNRNAGLTILAQLYEDLGKAELAAFWKKKIAEADSFVHTCLVLGDIAFEQQDYVFAAGFYAQAIDKSSSDAAHSVRTVYRLLFSLDQFTGPSAALHRHQRQLLGWRLMHAFQGNRSWFADPDFWRLRRLCESSFPSIYCAIFKSQERFGQRIAQWWKALRCSNASNGDRLVDDERQETEVMTLGSVKKPETRQKRFPMKRFQTPSDETVPLPRKPPVPRQSPPKRSIQPKKNQERSPPKQVDQEISGQDAAMRKIDKKTLHYKNNKATPNEYEASPTKRKLSAVRRLRKRQLDDGVGSTRPELATIASETTTHVPDTLLEIYPLHLPSPDAFILAHGRHPGFAELDVRQVEEFARLAHYRARVITSKNMSVSSLTSERVKPRWLHDLDKTVAMLAGFQKSRQRLDSYSIAHLSEIHARLVLQLESVYGEYVKEVGTTSFGLELQAVTGQLSAWGFDTVADVMGALQRVAQLGAEDEKQRNLEFYHIHRSAIKTTEKFARDTIEK